MPVASADRPIESLREESIDRLIMSYAHGELSLEAFERRLEQAIDTASHAELASLTADLSSAVDGAYVEKKREALGLPPKAQRASVPAGDVDYMIHIFGGSNRSGQWTVAAEIRMVNVFGGADLDFSDARFTAQQSHVTMFNLFGGATLYVPEHVNVVSKALCIFGGIDNRASSNDDAHAPTLVVGGICIFGGATIKVRGALRKRLRKFAESVKDAFGPVH